MFIPLAPWIAVIIFVLMFVFILLDKVEHHWVTLSCAAATLILVFGVALSSWDMTFEVLNLASVFNPSFWYETGQAAESTVGINWATIIFIAGMMIMVEGMAQAGVFRWLCLRLAKMVNYKASRIFFVFMLLSWFLAMFIDSITVILFLAAATIELAKTLEFDPIPFILAEIFCSNLGGAATMCGDPPNIIIGTSLGYTFGDFITNTGLISVVGIVVTLVYFWLCFRKQLSTAGNNAKIDELPYPEDVIENKNAFLFSMAIFLVAIVLLVTHASTGLTIAFIGSLVALFTLLLAGKNTPALLKKIDYKTLLFFIGLFIVVGGLEETGVLEVIANMISYVSGGNAWVMVAIILWVSAIASAFVDNIPFSATMIPVIKTLAVTQGVPLATLAWTLSIGTDIGGSATPIGASANVVGTAVAINNGYPVGWGKYCKYNAPATILVLLVSMGIIFMRYL